MAECPACERPLRTPTSCVCGWSVPAIAPVMGVSPDPTKCAACAAIWEKRKDYRPYDLTSVPAHHCYGCGAHDAGVAAFPDDTPCVPDRGMRVCATCALPLLKRRATCPHEWALGSRNGEKCERCELEIQGLRDLGRAYMDKVAERNVSL